MTKWTVFSWMFHRRGKEPRKRENIEKTIEEARARRETAESKIDGMCAQLNGCGDRWFLHPVKSLDECGPEEVTDK
jgi:hypothetical protein